MVDAAPGIFLPAAGFPKGCGGPCRVSPACWPRLAKVRLIPCKTADNWVRTTPADHFAGAAADEIEDPRILSEILRQWSTLHPEFSFLPQDFRKDAGVLDLIG